ncbi:MAG TPA: FecR domain-containing protein [Devosia sp.]
MLLALPAMADDWVVSKLRGTAEVLVDETWTALKRGDKVSDGRQVRTLGDSRVELQHGEDIIALDPDTLVSIEDNAAESFTIVHQSIGVVEVDAEVRDTYHLTVETKFLAAVVKGTHFIVRADDTGASVEVTRGLVAVQASESKEVTSVPPGVTASVREKGEIQVAGMVTLPMIFDAKGVQIPRQPAAEPYRPAPPMGGSVNRSFNRSSAGVQSFAFAFPELGGGATMTQQGGGGVDLATTGIGIAIGIMLGAIALLFRRVLR